MIVLGILGFMIAFGLPRFKNQKNNIKTVARQMASLSREVRNQARLKRMTFRIAFRLGDKPAYWVESAAGNVLIPSETTLEKLKSLDEKERPPSPFQKVTTLVKKEKELPTGLTIASVETPSMREPATGGMAYIYYTPEGLVERGVIQIASRSGGVTWTLIFNPITGHADTVEKPIQLKDLQID